MINNKILNKMIMDKDTRQPSIKVSNMLSEFIFQATTIKDKAVVKERIRVIVRELEELNKVASLKGLDPVYIEENTPGKDIQEYFLQELRKDDYGKKL